MPSQDLLDFIKQGLSAGKQPLEVQAEAMQLGKWSQDEISDAVNQALLNTSPSSPVMENSPSVLAAESGQASLSSSAASGQSGSWFGRHKKMVTLFILVGLLAAGGIYAASVYLVAPSMNKVGEKIFAHLEQAETMEYSGTIEGEIISDAFLSISNLSKYGFQEEYPANPKIAGSQNTQVRIDFSGASDTRDKNNPKSEFSFTITAEGMLLSVETKAIGQDVYVRIMEFPRLGIIEMDEHIGQWYKFDIEEIAGTKLKTDKALDIKEQERAKEIFKRYKIFSIVEGLGSTNVDGKSAHHYRYAVDKTALLNSLQESMGLMEGSESRVDKDLYTAGLEFSGGELWISKKDLAPLRVTFGMSMQSAEENLVSGKLNADIKIKSLGEEVSIEIPESFKSLKETLDEYLPSVSGAQARDAARLSDIRRAMIALEIYYNDTGEYPGSFGALFPEYLTQPMPTPTPSDGNCTGEENGYRYQAIPEKDSYNLTFCLGAETDGYPPGLRTAGPDGLK